MTRWRQKLCFSLLCCPIMCFCVLSFVLWCLTRSPHMFGSSLSPAVCMRAHVLFTLFVFIKSFNNFKRTEKALSASFRDIYIKFDATVNLTIRLYAKSDNRTGLYIWVTRRASYQKQELLTLREYLSSLPVCFDKICVAHFALVFCVVPLCAFAFLVSCCDVWYDLRICSVLRYLQLFVWGLMSYTNLATWNPLTIPKEQKKLYLPHFVTFTSNLTPLLILQSDSMPKVTTLILL
jgi:hypothetical protein